MEQVKYTVLILKKGSALLDETYQDLFNAFNGYKDEMAKLTEKDEKFYDVAFAFSSNDNAYICIAIDSNKKILGFILPEFDFITKTLWTSHVFVRKEYRMKGVYSMMMKRIQKFAKDAEFKRIFSLVHRNNFASIQAHNSKMGSYEWLGYEMEVKNGPEE